MSRTAAGIVQQFPNSTCSVYITYSKEEEAVRCIQNVHGFVLESRPLRACFGTTKYCHAWLHSAMGPLIKELDITLYTVHDFCFSLPQNISKCSNLVSLSLKGALSFKPQQPKSFSLSSLKTLGLDICGIDASSLNEFLQRCPCL
ncbi:hypothetical protein RYX36_012259 [Vicia faba]